MATLLDRALSLFQRAYQRGVEGASRAIASFSERLDRNAILVRQERGWKARPQPRGGRGGWAGMASGGVSRHKPGIGERIFGSAYMGAGMYGWPGGWSSDRLEQVSHKRHWANIAIDRIMHEVAGLTPNLAYVHNDGRNISPERRCFYPTLPGRTKALDYDAPYAQRSVDMRMRQWRYQKSLHQIKPHEEIEPAGPNHPLQRLLDHPNNVDTSGQLWAEVMMFLKLTGNAYLWAVPSELDEMIGTNSPAELWVIPSHWVWSRIRNGRIPEYYEVRPFIGPSATLRFPPEQVIHLSYKNPIHKFDGYSPLVAGAEWLDVGESIYRSWFWTFKNGAFPLGSIELDPQFNDPDDSQIDAIMSKFLARYQGEVNAGTPVLLPPGATYNPLVINPTEMAYGQSADSIRDMILALFGMPKEIAGIQDAGSEIAMYGPMMQFCRFCLSPDLRYMAQALTKELAHRWDDRLRLWWDDPLPENPEEVRANLKLASDCGWLTPNEGRTQLQLEPIDDPLFDEPWVSPTRSMPLSLAVKQMEQKANPPQMPPGAPGGGGNPLAALTGGKEGKDGGEKQPGADEEPPAGEEDVPALGKRFVAEMLAGWEAAPHNRLAHTNGVNGNGRHHG